MAELQYAKDGRLLFTKEMKEEYTILLPMMLPIHFTLMANSLKLEGYRVELLTTTHRSVVDEGVKNVHNDTCYPALLVIGQFIDALKSGKYDVNKTALLITQTGGGCRASNYIHLLRKALVHSGYDKVPVISLNLSGLEKNPGFSINLRVAKRFIYSLLYGDLIMCLANQCRPYEVNAGETDRLVQTWIEHLTEEYKISSNLKYNHVRANMELIAADFATLKLRNEEKVRVGVVGEIYIKYAALGNNNLEQFLHDEGVETVVPGLLDFVIFKVDNRLEDCRIYGGNPFKKVAMQIFEHICEKKQRDLIEVISKFSKFRAPAPFSHTKELVKGYLGYGNKMGEGWLLTGEMLELVKSGTENVVCTQPFGCLPNHIVGKGMIRKIKQNNPQANIVAIDYDPSATRVNQENRIKLMLANARLSAEKAHPRATSENIPIKETVPVH
ncbi:2-hydroxyglutaryl-CoA dehydratase [Ethanoligenens sp.]|uniref:2-hydroxyglutaryl-CoA dehydratase n=1 Tax=Ethanoligenens sp. TaxID=2099655 RepID=UPI0039E903B5